MFGGDVVVACVVDVVGATVVVVVDVVGATVVVGAAVVFVDDSSDLNVKPWMLMFDVEVVVS